MSNSLETGKITVWLNGVEREVPAGLTVRGLLSHAGVDPQRVAVELNRKIAPRTDWDSALVGPGAEIEIVEFVGGGGACGP